MAPSEYAAASGAFSSWPVNPDTIAAAPFVGDRITFIDNRYKSPRAAKLDAAVTRTLSSGIAISLSGGYHHTDYLLRRSDINLPNAPLALTSEGRPIFGTLVQQGSMITASPGSNRRFGTFDMVSEMASTGFSDYYEAGIEIARRPLTGFSFAGSYTYSHTTDNWASAPATRRSRGSAESFPQRSRGQRVDPGPLRFRPSPPGPDHRCLPHRREVSHRGRPPLPFPLRITLHSWLPSWGGCQWRWLGPQRSSLPRPQYSGYVGVVSQNACLQGQAGLLERNSCREPSNHALDLSASFGIPVGSAGNLELTLDAFNLVATETGLLDRALLLIDPSGSITTDGQGNVVLPLIANPHFGKLLIRRGEGRVIRVGLRVGY